MEKPTTVTVDWNEVRETLRNYYEQNRDFQDSAGRTSYTLDDAQDWLSGLLPGHPIVKLLGDLSSVIHDLEEEDLPPE